MDTKEENCFNILWKIKNFSYCVESIGSPEFTYDGDQCSLSIHPDLLQCQLLILTDSGRESSRVCKEYQLSLLPCDGSSPLTANTRCLQVSREILFRTRRSSFLPDDTLTVQFHFPTTSERGSLLVQSEIGVKRKCFLWTMKNFIEDLQEKGEFKKIAENTEWFGIVGMKLKSIEGVNSDELFSIEISLTNGDGCYCVLEVNVLDVDGKAINCVNGEFIFEVEGNDHKWNFPPIIKKKKLLACKDRLLPGGTLTLKCNFAIAMGTVTDETAVLSYRDDITPLLKESADLSQRFNEKSSSDSDTDLKNDLKRILENEIFSDVCLQVSSEVIHVHMNILAARSPVFHSIFIGGIDEINDNTIIIDDLDVETVNRFLLYVYTDIIKDSHWKNIKKLYLAANKYEVQSLKQKCSTLLKSKFSVFNICEVLALSDSHNDADLKADVLDFISKHDSEVFASKKWKDLEKNNCSLALQALREICLQK